MTPEEAAGFSEEDEDPRLLAARLRAAPHQPREGDDVEAWLTGWRDFSRHSPRDLATVDAMLLDYQWHASEGKPLRKEAGGDDEGS